ncbi:MAG: hypothetical protein J1E06_05850 [Acutalibacter sp.]|nr:hypothetical protein [Acutalibacter sp.]
MYRKHDDSLDALVYEARIISQKNKYELHTEQPPEQRKIEVESLSFLSEYIGTPFEYAKELFTKKERERIIHQEILTTHELATAYCKDHLFHEAIDAFVAGAQIAEILLILCETAHELAYRLTATQNNPF